MNNQDQILKELKIQSAWLRAIGTQAIKDIIRENITLEQDKQIYELSDGEATTREIAKKVGSSHVKVADKWKKWASLGLMTPSESFQGRFKKIISLKDLGY